MTVAFYGDAAGMYGELPTADRTGYSFDGWYTGVNGGGTHITPLTSFDILSDHTLYAKWTPLDYAITYDLGGGTVSPANPTGYTVETATFSLNAPVKTDYVFTGWSGTGIAGTSTSVTIPKGSTGDRAYAAHWGEPPEVGTIEGTVSDETGPLEGANVRLTVGGSVYSATTAADGSYSITDVPAGAGYIVTAGKAGYANGSAAHVSVTTGATTSGVDIILALAFDQEGCLVTYRGAQKRFNESAGTYDIRFVATIDTLSADEVGFVFSKSQHIPTRENATVKATTTVYTSITAAGVTVTAADLGGTYIIACTVTGIPESDLNTPLYVRVFSTVGTATRYTPVVIVTFWSLP
jgi:uncharacterized repeat protein (TIGR02543 family)